MERLPAVFHAIATFYVTLISEPSWELAAVVMVIVLGLCARQTAQQLPGERVLNIFVFIFALPHGGCLLLVGETFPAIPQKSLWSTTYILPATRTDAQMLVAASVAADAET